MSTTKDLRTKSPEELLKDVDTLEEDLYKLRFRKVTDVEDDPSKYKKLKKQIARTKTVLREMEIEAAKTAIVFVNTRSQAEILFQELWRRNDKASKLPGLAGCGR